MPLCRIHPSTVCDIRRSCVLCCMTLQRWGMTAYNVTISRRFTLLFLKTQVVGDVRWAAGRPAGPDWDQGTAIVRNLGNFMSWFVRQQWMWKYQFLEVLVCLATLLDCWKLLRKSNFPMLADSLLCWTTLCISACLLWLHLGLMNLKGYGRKQPWPVVKYLSADWLGETK